MNFLTLENVTKSYGPKILFKNVNLFVNKGDRIALVAKNGSGKSTLLRVLAGVEGSEGEQSKILFAKDVRIGVLDQDPELPGELKVQDAIFATDNALITAVKNYELALTSEDTNALQKAMDMMDELQAWEIETKIKEIISELKIDGFLEQRVSTLSGGQKKRVSLAQMLIGEPDFMILDEPTNHLDLEMIEWLENYFSSRPTLTIFMVTHDRYFLDAVCNTIIELEGGNFYRYRGNYTYFLEQKALRDEINASTLDKTRKLFKRELDWMSRTAPARTSKNKSRIDEFYDIKDKVSAKRDNEDLQIDIKTTYLGSKILELHNLSYKIGDRLLIKDFSYKFKRGDRIGIVGMNGVGKSTFLKLITEQIKPTGGKVAVGDTISFGYYSQDGLTLKEDKRVIEVITDIAEYIPLEKGAKMTASSLLERFLFSREQQQVYASQLSGGEKRRLYLLTVLMKNPNFLILDEPTNDLDIVSLNVLEDFLDTIYNGCLVIVTHDRYFMDKLVDHLFIFEGEGVIQDSNGNYTEYREGLKQQQRDAKISRDATKNNSPAYGTVKKQVGDGEKKELKKLERDLSQLEERKQKLTEKFNDVAKLSHNDITKFSKELDEVQNQLEEKEMRWLELSE